MILAPEWCGRKLFVIKLMNSGYSCLFHKGFFAVLFSVNEQDVVTLPQRAQIKHSFWYKQNKSQNHKSKFLEKKSIWNYCIRD